MLGLTIVRLRTYIGAAVLAFVTIGCDQAAPTAPSAAKGIHVELSSSAVDANWVQMIQAMKDHIAAQSGETITFNVSDAALSVDKQISDIQTATVKRPDIIIVDPVDAIGILPAVQAAKTSGIKLFNIRPAPSDPVGLYDGTLNFETVYIEHMTARINGLLDSDPKLVLVAGVLYGPATQTYHFGRGDVVKSIAAARPGRLRIVAEKYADWRLDAAQDATADFITAHPDLNLIVAANNQMAIGAANAIASVGKTGTILVASYDIDVPTVRAIMDGKISFTTGLDFSSIGRAIIKAGMDIVNGTYTGSLDFSELYAVDTSNAAEALAKLSK